MPRQTTPQTDAATLDQLDAQLDAPAVLLRVAEVATQLRVDPYTVRRYIARGELPAFRIGRELRVGADELAAYLAGRRVSA